MKKLVRGIRVFAWVVGSLTFYALTFMLAGYLVQPVLSQLHPIVTMVVLTLATVGMLFLSFYTDRFEATWPSKVALGYTMFLMSVTLLFFGMSAPAGR